MAASTSSFGDYANQAAREALLRFGPQRSNLAELIREAQEGYGSRIRAARTGALGTKAAVNKAIPQIRQIFSGAQGASTGTANLLQPALQGADPNSPFRQSAAAESALALQQLVARKASEESRLKQEGVSAQQGLQFAGLTAQNILAKELRSLLNKRSNVAGEEGVFATTQADKAAKEAAKEAAEEARSKRTDETSRKNAEEGNRTRREIAEGKYGPGGVKPLSPDKQAEAASSIRSIEDSARRYAAKGHTRSQIEAFLVKGAPAQTVEGHKLAGREAVKHDVLMEAALDSAIGYEGVPGEGSVSRGTLRKLHNGGYSLKALSLSGPRSRTPATGVRGGIRASRR